MGMIPFDKREGKIWYDGELVEWGDARLHVLSHGLHYGSCVFEGNRIYGGKIFKLTDHSRRLIRSGKLIGMDIPYSAEQIDEYCLAALNANNIVDGYMRPVAWRGSEMMAISAQKNTIHMAIACWEWPTYFSKEARERGLRLKTSYWRRPAPNTAPTASKAAGLYMICTMSKHEAESQGYDDALMLDYRGLIAECTGANIFFRFGDRLHTPIADCFLDGITRRTVIDLARKRGIDVVESYIKPQEILKADEVFITGSAAEITPIGEIDGHKYTVGPMSAQLLEDYMKLARE